METNKIEKIKEYLKNLKIQEFKEWVYMPEDYKIDLPEFIGKSIFWLIWKNRKYNIEREEGKVKLSFTNSPLTVTCEMKGLFCIDAYGFNDDPYQEPELPTTNKIQALYASLLVSPLVSKEDLISIFGIDIEKADLSLIQRITE